MLITKNVLMILALMSSMNTPLSWSRVHTVLSQATYVRDHQGSESLEGNRYVTESNEGTQVAMNISPIEEVEEWDVEPVVRKAINESVQTGLMAGSSSVSSEIVTQSSNIDYLEEQLQETVEVTVYEEEVAFVVEWPETEGSDYDLMEDVELSNTQPVVETPAVEIIEELPVIEEPETEEIIEELPVIEEPVIEVEEEPETEVITEEEPVINELEEDVNITPPVNDTLGPIEEGTEQEELIVEEAIDFDLPEEDEPVIEEPVIEEPDEDEPVIEEPVEDEPVYEEPVEDEPIYEEPIEDEPVYEEPVIEEPEYEEPVEEEPVYEEPVIEEPEYEEPVEEEPVYEEPEVETPSYGSAYGNVLATADKYLGVPYVWAGRDPSGFDCSGFVQYVYREAYGIEVGWWTGEQQYAGTVISVEEAQPGDLYFWGTYGGETTHVAIASGGGSYIHAPYPGTSVSYNTISNFMPQFAVRL